MTHPARTHLSMLLRCAISIVPATLLTVASCSQSSPNADNFSAGDDGADGSTGGGSGGAGGSGSGGGSTLAAGDDSAAGSSSSGGGSGGAADDSGNAGVASSTDGGADDSGGVQAHDGGPGTESDAETGTQHDSGAGTEHDAGTSTLHDSGAVIDHDSGTGTEHDSGTGSHDAGAVASHDAGGGIGQDAGGGGAGTTCTKNDAVCSADNTGCNVGSYYLYDNQWNCGAGTGNDCGPESAYGCSNSDGTVSWVTTSNQPKGNTAVLSYPAMQDNFSSSPSLDSFTTISSTFTETSPHVGDYEVAWDCWFNDYANEFMVWVDTYNQVPAGPKVATGVTLGGRTYDIYWAPSGGGGGTVSFYATTNFTSGTVNLLQLFDYGVSNGWLTSNPTVSQISFGTEVCSTNGTSATWTVSDYSVTAH
jgi:hypothetical protein